MKDGQVLPPEEFQKLPEEEQKRLEGEMEALQGELQKVLLQRAALEARVPDAACAQLNDEVTALVVDDLVDDLLAKYKDLPDVAAYLAAVQAQRRRPPRRTSWRRARRSPRRARRPARPSPTPSGGRRPCAATRSTCWSTPAARPARRSSTRATRRTLNLVGRVEQMPMMGALRHRLHPHQARRAAPRQRRLPDPGRAQGAHQPRTPGRD